MPVAIFKEIKSSCGLLVWVCLLNGQEIARSLSHQGVAQIVLRIIRKNKYDRTNNHR